MDRRQLQRLRTWTLIFMAGLVLSGATALPLRGALESGVAFLGEDLRGGGMIPERMAAWLGTVRDGIRLTAERAPFMFYGTDWLAFGHFAIALAFVGALRDPVRNRWLYQFGMLACAAVPPWAFVCGHIRGIPAWWSAIDAAFGVVGFVPVWLCDRWVGQIEQAPGPSPQPPDAGVARP